MSLFDRIFLSESYEDDIPTYSATLVVLEALQVRHLSEDEAPKRDLKSELRIAQNIQQGKHSAHEKHQARKFEQELKDHQAGLRGALPKPHPVLVGHFQKAQEAAAAKRAAKRIAKQKADKEARSAKASEAAKNVPRLTPAQEDHADDMVDHATKFYGALRGLALAQAHVAHLERGDPSHKELPIKRQELDSHKQDLEQSHKAIIDGMDKAGIHPAHINRILQPDLHDISPHGRRHMDAVAHFMRGKHVNGEYHFPEDSDGHHYFHSWASIHHKERLPRVDNNRVSFSRRGVPTGSSGPTKASLEKLYPSTVRQKPKTQEEIAREHSKHHMDKMAEDPEHEQYLRSNDKFKHVGDGVHELRYWRTGEENDAALRVYTDNKGEYLDHSGKQGGEQRRRIIRAKQRLKDREKSSPKQEWIVALEWFLPGNF